ncbi:hypothetical protein FOZ60_004670 [Perkinsus olseni]|uniref:Peptidase A1 domain-containing protein n=2 Tax=Perkinsus olseni TaxID=32597 RepID=A0A7J6NT22_PEROL|nr:hypothetical protein FOZ60_004670 [Perkinsus olseni]
MLGQHEIEFPSSVTFHLMKPMMSVHLLWIALAVSNPVDAAVVKVDISRELEGLSYGLTAKLKVDGQDVKAVVDTGARETFFIWRPWYETLVPGGCKTILYKCYDCKPDQCAQGPNYEVSFSDGSKVTLFEHTGKFAFDVGEVSIDFGLTKDYKSPSSKIDPHAGLGLRSSGKSTSGRKTLLDQLVSRKVISTDVFSLYLTTAEHATGKLILGGDDPSLYKAPMSFVKVVKTGFVTLTGFHIGGDSYPREFVLSDGYLDTGADIFGVPAKFLVTIAHSIATRGKKRFQMRREDGWYVITCTDRQYLPDLTFFMDGPDGSEVPLVITPDAYVEPKPKPGSKDCKLLVDEDPDNEWTIGHPALLGKYFSFRWGEKKIGIAELK